MGSVLTFGFMLIGGLEKAKNRNRPKNMQRRRHCVKWIVRYAQFNGDHMPNFKQIRLPPCETKKNVYKEYKSDCNDMANPLFSPYSLPHFYKVWRKKLKHIVIPRVWNHELILFLFNSLHKKLFFRKNPDFRLATNAMLFDVY